MLRCLCLAALTLLAAPALAAGGQVWYGLWNSAQGLSQRSALYDGTNNLYVRLTAQNSPQLVGAQIGGVRFYLSDKRAVRSARVWVTTNLQGEALASQEVPDTLLRDLLHDGAPTEVMIDGPVSVLATASPYASVYVGFTLELSGQPSTALMAGEGKGAPYSNYYNGTDIAAGYGALALQVLASGPAIEARSVGSVAVADQTVVAGGEAQATLQFTNQGSEPLSTLHYVVSIDGQPQAERSVTFSEPLSELGLPAQAGIVYEAPAEASEHTLQVDITQVNGGAPATQATAGAALTALSRLPLKRTVMEEFTGTWCLNCVRGFAGIDLLEQEFGHRFIAIAMHSDERDPMMVGHYRNSEFYKEKMRILGGLPSCTIDRWMDADPYCGYETTGLYRTNLLVAQALQRPAVADVQLQASWANEAQTLIDCRVETNFAYSSDDAHYRLILVLTANGLKGEGTNWWQNNGYDNYQGTEEALLQYAGRGYYLKDMVYNHVAVDIAGVDGGLEGSISSPLVADQPQHHVHTFDIGRNTIVQDRGQLSAIAMLIDTRTGAVVNAAKAAVGSATAVEGMAEERQVPDSQRIYDLQGRPAKAPSRTGFVVKQGRVVRAGL